MHFRHKYLKLITSYIQNQERPRIESDHNSISDKRMYLPGIRLLFMTDPIWRIGLFGSDPKTLPKSNAENL